MKGGHARVGPPPDPNALRRERPSDVASWTTLPAAGRSGAPPEWPLDEPTDRERHFWAYFWRKPQATEWERLGVEVEVAVYCRRLTEAEQPGASVSVGTLVKQLGEQLGLTIPGMRMHRWKIGPSSATPVDRSTQREEPEPAEQREGSRSRFRVVRDGAV